jgi:hypothetical protein
MTEALGRFRERAETVSREPGDIALHEVFIDLTDGMALSLQPLGKLLSGTQLPLETPRGIAFVVEGGCQVIEVQPQWPTPQPGNHAWPYKGVCEHVLLLFHKSCLEKEKDGMSGSCRVG